MDGDTAEATDAAGTTAVSAPIIVIAKRILRRREVRDVGIERLLFGSSQSRLERSKEVRYGASRSSSFLPNA
jgi:hypothetical protein